MSTCSWKNEVYPGLSSADLAERGHAKYLLLADPETAVFNHYGHACTCCGATENLGIDHIEPCRGRRPRNLYRYLVRCGFPAGFQVLCRSCNSSKGRGPHCRLACGQRAWAKEREALTEELAGQLLGLSG